MNETTTDIVEKLDSGAVIQHGQLNERIYLMKIKDADPDQLIEKLEDLAEKNKYGKIFAKVPVSVASNFTESGFRLEASIPNFYNGREDAVFLGKYFCPDRRELDNKQQLDEILELAIQKSESDDSGNGSDYVVQEAGPEDVDRMARLYKVVFPSYPFPIHDRDYLLETMTSHVNYYYIEDEGRLAALSSAEMNEPKRNVEMTDFATDPDMRGNGYALCLLTHMEKQMRKRGIKTAYTIARAVSAGMNITFARAGYEYGGRLINNTNISGDVESMNVWYKSLE